MGQKDSNLDLKLGDLSVGLHPEQGADLVYLSIGEAAGTMTSTEWLTEVVAVVGSDFANHTEAADAVAKACGVELNEDEKITEALQAIRGRGKADIVIRWHWGELSIDAKTTIDSSDLIAASKLPALRCGEKVARVLKAHPQKVATSRRLGDQVRFLVG